MMPVSKELQAVISKGATADVIEKQALAEGMLTLKMGAAQHVLNGITAKRASNRLIDNDIIIHILWLDAKNLLFFRFC
jgi:type IV pilus assembly protein PilB